MAAAESPGKLPAGSQDPAATSSCSLRHKLLLLIDVGPGSSGPGATENIAVDSAARCEWSHGSSSLSLRSLPGWRPCPHAVSPPPPATRCILITLDGARTRRCSAASTSPILQSTLSERASGSRSSRSTSASGRRRPEARREKLMPFFWGTLMREHGSIAGNRALGSAVRADQHAQVLVSGLLGDPHRRGARRRDQEQRPRPAIRIRPCSSSLKERLSLPPRAVAAFASWDVFNDDRRAHRGRISPSTPATRRSSRATRRSAS